MRRASRFGAIVSLAVFAAGCHTDMWTQPQTRDLEPNATFAFSQSARTAPIGTEPFTANPPDAVFETGFENGQPIQTVPGEEAEKRLKLKNLKQLLERGRERFDIFCSPCHGRLGDGNGMIAVRGLKLVRQPRNLHSARVLNAPDGHIFRVITSGSGAMFSYGDRIPEADRWAIVSYIRALQLSQGGSFGRP